MSCCAAVTAILAGCVGLTLATDQLDETTIEDCLSELHDAHFSVRRSASHGIDIGRLTTSRPFWWCWIQTRPPTPSCACCAALSLCLAAHHIATAAPTHAGSGRVKTLVGSPLVPQDLWRAGVQGAKAVFIVGDRSAAACPDCADVLPDTARTPRLRTAAPSCAPGPSTTTARPCASTCRSC